MPLAWVGPRDWGLWRVRAQLLEPEGPFQLAVAGSATVQDLPHPLCPAQQQQQLTGTPDLAGGTWNVLTTTSNSTLDPKTLAFLVMQHHTYHRSAHNRPRLLGALDQTARKHQTCALTCVWNSSVPTAGSAVDRSLQAPKLYAYQLRVLCCAVLWLCADRSASVAPSCAAICMRASSWCSCLMCTQLWSSTAS